MTRAALIGDFFAGAGYLLSGLRLWVTSPRIMFVGAIPAMLVGVVYLAGIIALALNLDAAAAFITPFANGWQETVRTAVRLGAGLAITSLCLLVAVCSFAAITLTVGDPFYERIWRSVESRVGSAPADVDLGFWRGALRSLGNAVRLLTVTVIAGLSLFVASFVPLVGQTLVPVAGALVGGWLLSVELSGYAFDSRGLTLTKRRRMLAARRARTLGFGVVTYLLFLVPVLAVVIMPAAVAGATLLSRDVLEEDVSALPRPDAA